MALIEYMRRRSRLLFAGATWQLAAEAVLPINAVSGHGLTRSLGFLDELAPHPIRLRWTAFTNTCLRLRLLLRLPLLLIFLPFMPVEALGKGGTNMHELANTRATVPQSPFPSDGSVGCGRGRYRDPRTHKCRGPADFRD